MLGGQKILKNYGESISDTQITVSWSVWKRNQKNGRFGQKMAIFDIFSCDWLPYWVVTPKNNLLNIILDTLLQLLEKKKVFIVI